MTAVLKRTNSVGHKKKEKQSADPKKRLSMQKNDCCLGFYGNARTIKWAQFFLLAQVPPLASSGCMRDIRVRVKHWQLIAWSTDQLSVLNNLPILLGAPQKRFWEATPRPLEIAFFWTTPPLKISISLSGGGGYFLELHMKRLLTRSVDHQTIDNWLNRPHRAPRTPKLLKPGFH